MRARLLLVALLLLSGLLAVFWPSGDPADAPGNDPPAAASPEPAAPALAQSALVPDAAAPAASRDGPSKDERRTEAIGLRVSGQVLGGQPERHQVRLAFYRDGGGPPPPWLERVGVERSAPKSLEAAGHFSFDGPFPERLAGMRARVELGIAGQYPGDEVLGATPLLVLAVSETFTLEPGVPVDGLVIEAVEAITLRVPLHGWDVLPVARVDLSIQREASTGNSQGLPEASYASEGRPRLDGRLRLSPLHRGERARVVATPRSAGSHESQHGEWLTLEPGEHLLPALSPEPLGLVEVRFRAARTHFPEAAVESGEDASLSLQLSQFRTDDPGRYVWMSSFHPARVSDSYDPQWGLRTQPSSAWDGPDFLARIGWIPAGTWEVSAEAEGLRRAIRPTRFTIRPFAVTQVEVDWLEPGRRIRLRPQPAGGHDNYVIATWAEFGPGEAIHAEGLRIGLQAERDWNLPAGAEAVGSLSVEHRNPVGDAPGSTRIHHYRGAVDDLRPAPAGSDGLPVLILQRAATQLTLPVEGDPWVRAATSARITSLDSQLGGRPIPFFLSGRPQIELLGFPPGHYRLELAASDAPEQWQTWQEFAIRSPPPPSSPDEAGEGN